jgi:hypothetical protein
MVLPRFAFVFACLGVLLTAAAAGSTTVRPVGFNELVSRSELIFVGQVVDRRSSYLRGADGPIVTDVVFDVIRVLKGSAGLRTQLMFLGGTVGRETLIVSGMPRFEIGERDMLFVSGDRISSNPLVGFWEGRFRIVRDPATGGDVIRTHGGGPVFDGLPSAAPPPVRTLGTGGAPAVVGLSLGEFETLVQQRVRVDQQRQRHVR